MSGHEKKNRLWKVSMNGVVQVIMNNWITNSFEPTARLVEYFDIVSLWQNVSDKIVALNQVIGLFNNYLKQKYIETQDDVFKLISMFLKISNKPFHAWNAIQIGMDEDDGSLLYDHKRRILEASLDCTRNVGIIAVTRKP